MHGDEGVVISGIVRAFVDGVLTLSTEELTQKAFLGQDVTVRVLDEVRGECIYTGSVARISVGALDVASAELVAKLQKREVARVRVSIPLTGRMLASGKTALAGTAGKAPTDDAEPGIGLTTAAEPDVDGQPALHRDDVLKFTLLDISAHGMRFFAKPTLLRGAVIRFHFEALEVPFAIDAMVVRAEKSRSGGQYGCRFTSLTSREQDILFRYVLKTQGAQRRERANA